MPSTTTQTMSARFRRVYATNVTASAYVARIDLTEAQFAALYATNSADGIQDTTNGYLRLDGKNEAECPDLVKVKFYGTDADNEAGGCRFYGVSLAEGGLLDGTVVKSYTHVLIGEYTFILSSACTGVAGGVVVATEYYADPIVGVVDAANVSDMIVSPTGDVPAHLCLDVKGFKYLLVEPIVTTAAGVNVLVAGY